MADPKPAGDGLTPLVDALTGLDKRQSDSETASGTQRAQAVRVLQEQVAALEEQQEELARQLAFSQSPTAQHSVTSGFALNTSPQELIRLNFTMPAGFTRAQVFGSTTISTFNQNGGLGDVLRCSLEINGSVSSTPTPVYVPPLSGQSMSAAYGQVLTLPAGSSFWVRAVAYNQLGNTGSATALNVCNIDATVLFLR
jgi:hypothetical protein